MASANLGPVPYFTVLDSSGNPISGAKIQTYISATSTPANTYTDRTAATTNANPVVCDSAGRCVIYFDDSVVYKLVITNAADVVIETIDPYSVNAIIGKLTTLTVSGNGTIGGTLGVTGNVAVNTNKFNVTASSGNTAIAGALDVTGASALVGALTLQGNAISAASTRFNPKQALVRVTKSAVQSINNTTVTPLTWDQESFDTDTLHSTSVNTSRITAAATGKYLVTAAVTFAANATGYRQVKIVKNGVTDYAIATALNLGAADTPGVTVSDIVDLAASDYVEIAVAQNSGGALNVAVAGTTASMVLLGT
jgi:hypothetical protein